MIPRRHPRQLPYVSLRASIPIDAYVFTSQSFPAFCCGVPVSRGPIESSSGWANEYVRELSIPDVQIRRSTESLVAKVWARAAGASDTAATADSARRRSLFMTEIAW